MPQFCLACEREHELTLSNVCVVAAAIGIWAAIHAHAHVSKNSDRVLVGSLVSLLCFGSAGGVVRRHSSGKGGQTKPCRRMRMGWQRLHPWRPHTLRSADFKKPLRVFSSWEIRNVNRYQ